MRNSASSFPFGVNDEEPSNAKIDGSDMFHVKHRHACSSNPDSACRLIDVSESHLAEIQLEASPCPSTAGRDPG